MTNTNEPNGTPDVSPIAAIDDVVEGTGLLSNRINDEGDDDDPFSKRRYDNLTEALCFFLTCTFGLMNELSNIIKQEDGYWRD